MKLYRNIYTVVLATALMASTGCTDGFEEANRNPNQTDQVNPEYLFNTSVYNTLDTYCGSMKKVLLANYAQYYGGAVGGQIQRYANQGSTNDEYWRKAYNAMLPLQFVDDKLDADGEYHNRVLITRIWKYYLYSQAASIWGPIPMSGALSGNPHVPYDSEKDIYYALLDGLKECAEGIDPDGDAFIKDPIYPSGNGFSDLDKWIKFANSLRLRLAVRICNADEAKAKEVISELMSNESLMMTSNSDNCCAKWGDNVGTRNYFYDYLVVNRDANSDKLHSAGEAILMYTAPYNDPRVKVWFTEADSKTMPDNFQWAPYWGQPKVAYLPYGVTLEGGNPHSGKTAVDYSQLKDNFTAESYAEVIMSYAEVCLLKSEAAYKSLGSGSKTAADYYEQGVRASMSQYGVSGGDAESYLQVPGIKWNTLTDLNSTQYGEDYYKDFIGIVSSAITAAESDPVYRQIIMQQYIALFYQPLDAWTLHRRSQVLEFTPHLQPETGYGAINAGTADNPYAYVPARLVYPDSERVNNLDEMNKGVTLLGGNGDTMGTMLWWAVPYKLNPYL